MIIKLLGIGILTLAMGLDGHAQMNRFKSKSRFNPPSGNDNNANSQQAFTDDENNTQTFGQRTAKLPENKKSQFVNLNPDTAFGPEIVTDFNFPNADIKEVTEHMQKLTGINLILDKDVKGKVSITTFTPITVGDAWKAYLAALNMAGYTLVKSGAFYKIINARDVRYVPTQIYTGAYTPETEAHIMKVMTLKYVDASEISRNFRPFMSRYGRIIDLKQTNTIIISDTGANIARLVKLIKYIDVPGHDESLQIIKVKNSSAQEIAKLLDEILRSGSSGSSSRRGSSRTTSKRFSSTAKSAGSQNISKIIAEPRTNSIIAMANADGAEELRILINKLDVPFSSANSDKIHVHYLNYGNAEELAKTLSSLVSGSRSASTSSRSSSSRAFLSRTSDGSTLFNGEVKINADKNNNALVVTASATDWLTIKNVIGKLDIPRDQVYVEGLIMETSATTQREFGVEYLGAYGSGAAQRSGFLNSGTLTSVAAGNFPNGLFIGGTSGSSRKVNLGAAGELTVNPLNAMIKAVAADSNTNVLATPQLLVMDNTDAEFEVGREVPVRELTTATNGNQTATTTRQKASLNLKITPQINKVTRFVKLKINQQINDFIGDLDTSGTGQATNNRSAVTEVMVRDKDTVVMGGLLRDRETISFNKVPLLGDIPVLGWLFKSKGKKIEKVNLLMFMTPTILTPYEKTASRNTLESLEERVKSLKPIVSDDTPEPFLEETAALKKKVQAQIKGPLYDTTPNIYQRTNEGDENVNFGGGRLESYDMNREDQPAQAVDRNNPSTSESSDPYLKADNTPNYQKIADDLRAKKIENGETPEPVAIEPVEIEEE